MTEAFHGADRPMSSEFSFGAHSRLKYRELGGLSAFLSLRAVLDVHQEAVRQSEVRSLFCPCRSTDSFTIRKMNAAEIPENFEAIEKQLRDHPDTVKYWQTTARPAVENLQRQVNQSEEKLVEAAGPVKTAAEKLVTMPPFSKQVDEFKKKFNPKELYEKEGVKDDKGWNKFLKKLSQFKS
ncbi:MAG: hypothetical protein K2X93_09135 [Candidatus Obscuribacterales bacterium]|nr:hypothetical protein [Candidatus Obscuribacterales bacterium]